MLTPVEENFEIITSPPPLLWSTSPIFRLKFVGKWGRKGGGKKEPASITEAGSGLALSGGTMFVSPADEAEENERIT